MALTDGSFELIPYVLGLAEPSSANLQEEVQRLQQHARRSDLEAPKVPRSLWRHLPHEGQPGRGLTRGTLTHTCPLLHP